MVIAYSFDVIHQRNYAIWIKIVATKGNLKHQYIKHYMDLCVAKVLAHVNLCIDNMANFTQIQQEMDKLASYSMGRWL